MPPDPPPIGFPVIASMAPLAAAGAIWAITGSAFALIFAVLSPVIAVATMFDGRRTNRKRRRQDAAVYSRAIGDLRAAVAERHELLRRTAWRRTPSVSTILSSSGDADRWRQSSGTLVTLGSGTVASDVRLDGSGDSAEYRELRDWAATLAEAPITAEAHGGIGIIGPLALTRALARGLLVQLCFALPPGVAGLLAVPTGGWTWTATLPHAEARAPTQEIVVSETHPKIATRPGATRLIIALAATIQELPPGCETVVRMHGPGRAEIVRSTVHAWAQEFRPELIAIEQAARFAALLREQALAVGLVAKRRSLPDAVALTDLQQHRATQLPGATGSLKCAIGLGEQGEVSLDLVGAGPHAVVGGTTGSGKSELLVTWVASMAARYSPAQVTFLLVDFKGGAAFRPLGTLPHCVGLITDLDQREASRALASLAAELHYRERALRDAGARDVGEVRLAAALPRLVIVVDEFATMLDAFPELHALFVDVAARGRSLGVHLILCTQRPAGIVRDALLANCSLRLSLRVNNKADSQAVIGTDAAAALSPTLPGRCLVETGAGGTVLCQVATTDERDIRAIADQVSAGPTAAPSPRRPWLDPLPAIVTEQDLLSVAGIGGATGPTAVAGAESSDGADRMNVGPGYRLGLLDEPEHQRYRVAGYDPAVDGHLLVVGGARSGKSTVLASLAAQESVETRSIESVTPDVEAAWDALERARRSLDAGPGGGGAARLLLFDDFDSVCARWDPDYRLAAIDLLTGLLRDGQMAGLHLVIAVQRLAGALQALPTLCQSTLLLRLPNRQEYGAAGGVASLFDDALPPGGGCWQGARIQLLRGERGSAPGMDDGGIRTGIGADAGIVAAPILDLDQTLLVVSGTPARSAVKVRSSLNRPGTVVDITGSTARGVGGRLELTDASVGTIFVGDADSWQAQWGLLGALRAQASIVFDGCSLADYRLISRRRELPPALAPGLGHVWVLRPDGTILRASLPPKRQ